MVTLRSPRAIPLAQATKQRARLAAAQADLAELKAAKQHGTMLDADAVEAGVVGRFANGARRYVGGAVAVRGAVAASHRA